MKSGHNSATSLQVWRELCREYYKAALAPEAVIADIRDHVVICWFDTSTGSELHIDDKSNVSASAAGLVTVIQDIRADKEKLAAYNDIKKEVRNTAHTQAAGERKAATVRLAREMATATKEGDMMQSLMEWLAFLDKDLSLLSITRGLVAWLSAIVGHKQINTSLKVPHVETLSERPKEVQQALFALLFALGATMENAGQGQEEEGGAGLVFEGGVSVSDYTLRRLAKYASRRALRHCSQHFDFHAPSSADAAIVVHSALGARERTNQDGQLDELWTFIDNRLHVLCPIL